MNRDVIQQGLPDPLDRERKTRRVNIVTTTSSTASGKEVRSTKKVELNEVKGTVYA